MTRRAYLRAFAAILLFVAVVHVLPVLLALARFGGPTFGLYDLRGPQGRPAYRLWKSYPAAVTDFTTVYGPSVTQRYESSVTLPRLPARDPMADPTATAEAPATETITLPDGKWLRLRAMQFWPQCLPGSPLLPVEEVYCNPDGTRMPREAAAKLNHELDPVAEPSMAWNPTTNIGLPWTIGFVLESNVPEDDLTLMGLFDVRTGGSSDGRVKNLPRRQLQRPPAERVRPPDDPYDPGYYLSTVPASHSDGAPPTWLTTVFVPFSAVRPTPLELHLRVRHGPQEILSLPTAAPQKFEWQGRGYEFRQIIEPDKGAKRVYAGYPLAGPPQYFQPGSGHLLVFYPFPGSITAVRAFRTDGSEIARTAGRMAEYEIVGQSEFGFAGPPQDSARLEISLKPAFSFAVLRLPDLPIIPEQNRHTGDLMKMVVPPTAVADEREFRNLLGAVLQTQYNEGYPMQHHFGTFAWKLGGSTVRELVMEDRALFPSEVKLDRSESGVYMYHQASGKERAKRQPRLTAFLTQISRPIIPVVAVALLAIIRLTTLLLAVSLRGTLRRRGYTALRVLEVEFLLVHLGRRTWKLPSRDELAIIPGVDVEDMRTVVALMRKRSK